MNHFPTFLFATQAQVLDFSPLSLAQVESAAFEQTAKASYRTLCILYIYLKSICIIAFTCVALAKAGLVMAHLHPSATLLGCLVCVICNSKRFHSFSFKLCIMIVHILKMCTSYFMHISRLFSFLRVVGTRHFCVQNAYKVPGLCNL